MKKITTLKKDKNNASLKAFKIILLIYFTLLMDLSVFAQITPNPLSPEHYYDYLTERPEWAGFWINVYGKTPDFTEYLDVMAGETDKPKWANMEPSDGVYDFALLKERLRRAVEMDTYYYCEMWLGGTRSPSWMLESNGGPVAEAFSNEGKGPYFLDPDYLKFSERFFKRLASEIASYDTSLINRFAFIQPGFGSTGDRQLYKGTVTPPEYNLSKSEYVYFMQTQVKAFTSAFRSHEKTKNIRFLWNISNYEGSDPNAGEEQLFGSWMKAHYNCQLRKQQFTTAIGYMAPDEMDQDRELRDDFFGNGSRWGGNPEFIRGEFNDAKWNNTPMAKIDKQLNYYWTGISSVDRGIDAWEGKYTEMKPEYKEAYAFSHRYSYYKKAESSSVAFIALRDVLDYSDGKRFPEATYGAVNRGNVTRINNILSEFSSYGAQNDDTDAVMTMSQAGYLANSAGYNDCVWNVITRNYRRFITQIEPNETSVGYWRVDIGPDKQPYGRFARGFDVEQGKNTMYFDVDDAYFSFNRDIYNGTLKIKIIWYANDSGSWQLQYHAKGDSMKTALDVTNDGVSGWMTKEVVIEDALLDNGGLKGADLILQNTGNTNCRFHIIELERELYPSGVTQSPFQGTNRKIPGLIEAEHYDEGGQGIAFYDNTLKQGDTTFRTDDNVDVVAKDGAGNGYVVGYTNEGEWLEYTVDVTAGKYDITLYYFCGEAPGDLVISLNSVSPDTISGMQNQGWDKLDSITVENVLIPASGTGKILRLQFANGAGFDIDAIKFTKLYAPVTDVTLTSCPSDTLYVGDNLQLMANVSPYYANDKAVIWESSDESVATVDSGGLVTAISEGSATITVVTTDGGLTDSCAINAMIEVVSVYGVTIGDCPWSILQTGDTHQLTANIAPADATHKSVTWSSSNPEVAAVDSNGLITAISQGTAKISITTNDGGYTNSCSLGIQGVTGVNIKEMEENLLGGVEIYPIPASEVLNFRFSESVSEKIIYLYNTLGQLLFSKTTYNSNPEINIREFSSEEMLIVKVITDEASASFKVVVNTN